MTVTPLGLSGDTPSDALRFLECWSRRTVQHIQTRHSGGNDPLTGFEAGAAFVWQTIRDDVRVTLDRLCPGWTPMLPFTDDEAVAAVTLPPD